MARSYLQDVHDESQVAEARRVASTLARQHGLTAEAVSDVAIVVTEAATNLIKHAGGGQLVFRALSSGSDGLGLEVISIDKGPGISNVTRSMADGYSTAGTPGNGLGSIQRQSRTFDVYSKLGDGTLLVAEVWNADSARPRGNADAPRAGVINLPIQGEQECGDGWATHYADGVTSVLVIDGLGHGPLAAAAAETGVKVFAEFPGSSAGEHVQRLHGAMRPTRGAAGAVAVINHSRGTLGYCGIGNIAGVLVADGVERHLVSHNGTMGHESKARSEFMYPWTSDSLLIMTSDGIASRWSILPHGVLSRRHPSLIAAMIFRDHCRRRDDATVLVLGAKS